MTDRMRETDRKRERLVLLQIPQKWHRYPILNAWAEVYCNVFGCGIQAELCSLFSLLLCLPRRKIALHRRNSPPFWISVTLLTQYFSHRAPVMIFALQILIGAVRYLQCIYCCPVDHSWRTSACGAMLSKQGLHILRQDFIISLKSSYEG